jgi:imidazoleglycerol-phosphate dehydratase
VGEHLVRTVADEDLLRLHAVALGDAALERVGIGVGVELAALVGGGTDRFQRARRGAVGVLVGVELDQLGELGLLARDVGVRPLTTSLQKRLMACLRCMAGGMAFWARRARELGRWYHARDSSSRLILPEAMRQAEITRNTLETKIRVASISTARAFPSSRHGVGFFDHMLDQIARHGMIDFTVEAKGDLHIDAHHTIEDVGITLGQALSQGPGRQEGLRRYGHAYVPLDEALSRVVVDLLRSPGAGVQCSVHPGHASASSMSTWCASSSRAGESRRPPVHIDALRGDNSHHQAETVFKAFARALRMAVEADPRAAGAIPSTKGAL